MIAVLTKSIVNYRRFKGHNPDQIDLKQKKTRRKWHFPERTRNLNVLCKLKGMAATCGGKKRSSCPKSLVARKTPQILKETVSRPALTWQKQSFLPSFLQTSARTHMMKQSGVRFHFRLITQLSLSSLQCQKRPFLPNFWSFRFSRLQAATKLPIVSCTTLLLHCSLLNLLIKFINHIIRVSNQMEDS